jgi:methanogenic corrinoid protein MtbC1
MAISAGLAEGLRIVGEKFEQKEYFLSELVVAAEVMKEAMSVIQPHIKVKGNRAPSRVDRTRD